MSDHSFDWNETGETLCKFQRWFLCGYWVGVGGWLKAEMALENVMFALFYNDRSAVPTTTLLALP